MSTTVTHCWIGLLWLYQPAEVSEFAQARFDSTFIGCIIPTETHCYFSKTTINIRSDLSLCGLLQVNAATEEPATWAAQRSLVEASTKTCRVQTTWPFTLWLLTQRDMLASTYWRTSVQLLGTMTSCGMTLKCEKSFIGSQYHSAALVHAEWWGSLAPPLCASWSIPPAVCPMTSPKPAKLFMTSLTARKGHRMSLQSTFWCPSTTPVRPFHCWDSSTTQPFTVFGSSFFFFSGVGRHQFCGRKNDLLVCPFFVTSMQILDQWSGQQTLMKWKSKSTRSVQQEVVTYPSCACRDCRYSTHHSLFAAQKYPSLVKRSTFIKTTSPAGTHRSPCLVQHLRFYWCFG